MNNNNTSNIIADDKLKNVTGGNYGEFVNIDIKNPHCPKPNCGCKLKYLHDFGQGAIALYVCFNCINAYHYYKDDEKWVDGGGSWT